MIFYVVIVIIGLILMFLIVPAFADTDRLDQKELDFFAALNCDDPNAISGFKWNFSNTKSQAEQCKIYQTASKLLQLFRVMDLNHTMSDLNHTMKAGNAYHSDSLKFPDDAFD